jgi:hypothetical protein
MMASSRRMAVGAAVLALLVAGSAAAQENLDQGKTPAQLYAADCAICHKTPHGLSKVGGMFGLQGFLREHYTASKESAAAIAAYLFAVDREAPPTRASKRAAKPKEKSKAKPGEAKSAKPDSEKGEAKVGEPKPSEAKPAETQQAKPGEAAPAAAKPAEAKPAEVKPVEAKAETKAETKADTPKPAADKPPAQAKPETEKKSD